MISFNEDFLSLGTWYGISCYIFLMWFEMSSRGSFIKISYFSRLISSNFANGFGNKRAGIRWIPCVSILSDVCSDCLFRDGDWILRCWCPSAFCYLVNSNDEISLLLYCSVTGVVMMYLHEFCWFCRIGRVYYI